MKVVNKPLRKKDAMQLVTGQPVYMDDVIPEGCLCVKLLRSPHANAIVESISTDAAMKVPGMERIFTWEDVPQDGRRYTQAGQTYPEASPYDRLVIDRHVRFVGDVVAIVAGEDEKCVDKAMRLIKVKYKVLEPLFDFTKAKDNPILVHPEDNWESLAPVGADNKRNLCAHDQCGSGDIEEVLRTSDIVIDRVYHTRACQQAMMETFRTYCSIDAYGRLPKLVNHVHLPVQAGSDRVLAAMKRGYTAAEYVEITRKLRELRPDISIATDFIVGFPGETAEDFEDTMKLVEEVGFDASFSFIYSPRPGTPAARLPDDTPYDVKLARLQRLQATIDANATRISESMLGTEQRVLVLGPARKGEGFLMARTDNNRIVNFEGPLSLVDTMVRVKVTDVYPHSLGGQLLD